MYFSNFLESGINQFNKFIYSDKLKLYINQNNTKSCSYDDGPNCYVVDEKQKIIIYDKEEDFFFDYFYNEEWLKIFQKSKQTSFEKSLSQINFDKLYYKFKYSDLRDLNQNPPFTKLKLGLTFESYNELTINKDVYAEPIRKVLFYTEQINIEIFGKLRLHYGSDKIKNYEESDYPSKTYGIIESSNIVIKLGGKLFICRHFYIRKHELNDKIQKVSIDGYIDNKLAFSVVKDITPLNSDKWRKIILPEAHINKIIIPGGYEIDSFSFIIESNNQYNIDVQFYSDKNRRNEEMIKDDDIY